MTILKIGKFIRDDEVAIEFLDDIADRALDITIDCHIVVTPFKTEMKRSITITFVDRVDYTSGEWVIHIESGPVIENGVFRGSKAQDVAYMAMPGPGMTVYRVTFEDVENPQPTEEQNA